MEKNEKRDEAKARLLRAVLGGAELATERPQDPAKRQAYAKTLRDQIKAIGRHLMRTRSREQYRFLREQMVALKAARQAELEARPS